jgi:hypothetical protein
MFILKLEKVGDIIFVENKCPICQKNVVAFHFSSSGFHLVLVIYICLMVHRSRTMLAITRFFLLLH